MASKIEESCMTVMTVLDKLKEKLSLNVSCSESGQTSHHTPGAVTISNEVINGTSTECIKVLSPSVALSKGRPVSKRKESKTDQVIRKLKTRKRQEGNKTSNKKRKGKQDSLVAQEVEVDAGELALPSVPTPQEDHETGTQERRDVQVWGSGCQVPITDQLSVYGAQQHHGH